MCFPSNPQDGVGDLISVEIFSFLHPLPSCCTAKAHTSLGFLPGKKIKNKSFSPFCKVAGCVWANWKIVSEIPCDSRRLRQQGLFEAIAQKLPLGHVWLQRHIWRFLINPTKLRLKNRLLRKIRSSGKWDFVVYCELGRNFVHLLLKIFLKYKLILK